MTLAHQVEAMSREKPFRKLSHYLRRQKPASAADNSAVIAMFERLATKGEGVKITRIEI